MTFTYGGDPSNSTLEAIRFYSQDTNADDAFLSDEEINYIVAQWGAVTDNPMYLAAACCETISAKFARELSYSADGVSVAANELQDKFTRLAESLRDQYKSLDVGDGPDVGGILVGERYDSSIKPLTWAKGQHDNIEAGQQDYGGVEDAQTVYSESHYF